MTTAHENTQTPAAGRLLVSSPRMMDPFFGRSVILLLGHDGIFTFGVDLTREHPGADYKEFIRINDDLDILAAQPETERSVLFGGPCDNGYDGEIMTVFLHNSATGPQGAHVPDEAPFAAYSIAGKDNIDAYRNAPPPAHARLIIGYTGWSPDQLQDEIDAGSWRVIPATEDLVFSTDRDKLWEICAEKAGFKIPPPAPPATPAP